MAAEAAHRLNPDLQVTSHTCPLDPTTEDVYDDGFFSRVDGVVAALDSFQARESLTESRVPCPRLWQPHPIPSTLLPGHYVAARCTHYLKPLLEAGTQGTRGSASVFVPYVTEVYKGPTSAEDAPYPVCTLRHFPSTVEHSLQVRMSHSSYLKPHLQICSSSNTLPSFPPNPHHSGPRMNLRGSSDYPQRPFL